MLLSCYILEVILSSRFQPTLLSSKSEEAKDLRVLFAATVLQELPVFQLIVAPSRLSLVKLCHAFSKDGVTGLQEFC
jgi:hypothetical protein